MRIAVLMKDVPDLVEDLEVADSGQALAVDDLSYVPSEWDDQALEEALLIKEESGGEVWAVAIDTGDVDSMLYAALAKGADGAVKIIGNLDRTITGRRRAHILAEYLRGAGFDLVMTGVQAVDDLDGQIAGLVAGRLGWRHASVVREVKVAGGAVGFVQEYAGGRMAEFEADAPVLLGVQAARKTPRYVPIARIRQVAKTATIQEVDAIDPGGAGDLKVLALARPESQGRAAMWDGDADEVAQRIVELLAQQHLRS
jgi:electron transfer flavoprotein beta subunit